MLCLESTFYWNFLSSGLFFTIRLCPCEWNVRNFHWLWMTHFHLICLITVHVETLFVWKDQDILYVRSFFSRKLQNIIWVHVHITKFRIVLSISFVAWLLKLYYTFKIFTIPDISPSLKSDGGGLLVKSNCWISKYSE